MSEIVIAGSEYKSPAETAIATVKPWTYPMEVETRFRSPERLWNVVMGAGGQFHLNPGCDRWGVPDSVWTLIAPSAAITHDEAVALAWAQQNFDQLQNNEDTTPALGWEFYGPAMVSHTWNIQHTADVLRVRTREVWAMLRDGVLGGYELKPGIWRVSPASVAKYQERLQQKAAA